ncbi:unnamed protein product [Amoebophrya sp. A120]|nr:unnamed protein product [Amoebophrya sp. A120]|eukprot:GSA120T00000251001.1
MAEGHHHELNVEHAVSSSWRMPQASARSLAAVPNTNVFLAGSFLPDSAKNQVHVLQFADEENELLLLKSLALPPDSGPVASIAVSPKQPYTTAFVTGWRRDDGAVWISKKPGNELKDQSNYEEDGVFARCSACSSCRGTSGGTTSTASSAPSSASNSSTSFTNLSWHHCQWDPFESSRLLVASRDGATVCAVDTQRNAVVRTIGKEALTKSTASGSTTSVESSAQQDQQRSVLHAIAYDTHHSNVFAVGLNADLKICDLRTGGSSAASFAAKMECRDAHAFGLTAVQFNPNVPNQLLTGGEDAAFKIWDLRNTQTACVHHTSSAHSHWITAVAHNPFHDQLVLTAGSDCQVNLWRTKKEQNQNFSLSKNLKQVSQEDAVYSVAWSGNDAWVYCSLSYDGVVTACRVPMEEKYRILL